MRSLCCENQFSFIMKVELITITIPHLDSLLKRDRGEFGIRSPFLSRETFKGQLQLFARYKFHVVLYV